MKSPTSLSDNDRYPAYCQRAFDSENVFRAFRRARNYTSIVETVEKPAGQEYLESALNQTPVLEKYLSKFGTSERTGRPITFSFRAGSLKRIKFSPTTLRYIKFLSDLIMYFGSLNGMRIVDIGAGYGGLCKIIYDVFAPDGFTIVDLKPCLLLAKKYLSKYSITGVQYFTSEDLPEADYDLAISNYAFSEIRRDIQDIYAEKILRKASRGYMMCNHSTHAFSSDSYTDITLQDICNCKIIKKHPPLADVDNRSGVVLALWGDNPGKA